MSNYTWSVRLTCQVPSSILLDKKSDLNAEEEEHYSNVDCSCWRYCSSPYQHALSLCIWSTQVREDCAAIHNRQLIHLTYSSLLNHCWLYISILCFILITYRTIFVFLYKYFHRVFGKRESLALLRDSAFRMQLTISYGITNSQLSKESYCMPVPGESI